MSPISPCCLPQVSRPSWRKAAFPPLPKSRKRPRVLLFIGSLTHHLPRCPLAFHGCILTGQTDSMKAHSWEGPQGPSGPSLPPRPSQVGVSPWGSGGDSRGACVSDEHRGHCRPTVQAGPGACKWHPVFEYHGQRVLCGSLSQPVSGRLLWC